ncbi:hypothetical protein HGRIS_011981 [Hohenbuehelia grisea]|uniref:RHS repeat protein n=1 Tax=Hohenbuehelia grisea TaxID=104357 RepID=A0ABR3JWX0_9AGAR
MKSGRSGVEALLQSLSSVLLWSPTGIELNLRQLIVILGYLTVVLVCIITQAPLIENSTMPACSRLPSSQSSSYSPPRTPFNHLGYEIKIVAAQKEIAALGLLGVIVLSFIRPVRRLSWEVFFVVHVHVFMAFYMTLYYRTIYATSWSILLLVFYPRHASARRSPDDAHRIHGCNAGWLAGQHVGGYQAQPSTTFHTDFTGGNFYTGDFEGNGRIGLDLGCASRNAHARIVVGDLNGDVAKYVFIISSTLKSGSSVCRINFLESINGKLTFKPDPPFASAAESIFCSTKNIFFPYATDEDGKTSLVAATATIDNKLQLQVLRSTGPTLLPPEKPIATGINYNGNITLARASSTTSVDLVNTSNKSVGQAKTQLTVIRFFGDTFTTVDDVTQPGALSSFVTYADLRGVGRVDCLLNTREAASGVLNIKPMKSSASLQPVDFIAGYENGLGVKLSVAYARRSAIARRTPWTIPPLRDTLPTATPPRSRRERTRAQHHQQRVDLRERRHARSLRAHALADRVLPVVRRQDAQARAVRGEAGRARPPRVYVPECATVVAEVLVTATTYQQDHPFVGQTAEVRVEDTQGTTLKVTQNNWECTERHGKSWFLYLSSIKENHFEEGKGTFDVDVSYTHDDFGNIKNITVKNSQPGTQPLVIDTEYENDEANWVRTIEFDKAGNDSVITGPGKALLKLAYDETYSNVKTSWTYVTDGADPLVETVDFDLASGKPSKSTEPNGSTTSLVYDVLGRVIQILIGDKLVEKQTFETDGTRFYQIAYDDFGGGNVQFKTISHLDGLNRVWKTETPRPDKEDQMVYSEIEYDGSNRTIARSRDYLEGTTRLQHQYSFANGVAKITDTKSKGDGGDAVNARDILYHPNHEPVADKCVLPYVIVATDELQQTIRTTFDALGQPVSVEDPSGAKLAMIWDGLGRVVSRHISHTVDGTSKDINYTTALYEDDAGTLTIDNKLTGTQTITKMDWAQRPVSKQTADETTFTYDKGGENTKERLATVTSSKDIKHTFGYDPRGNVITSTINFDGKDYTTTYTWPLANELLTATNPDGSIIKRSPLADRQSVGRIELLDASKATRAWVNLNDYSNGNSRPFGCDFGNGLSAKSSPADNGTIASIELHKGSDVVHKQNWRIDAFSRITNYDLAASSLTSTGADNAFHYDAAGQLKKWETQGSSVPDEFDHDLGGNLKSKNGKNVNDGWQLRQIKGSDDRVEFSFKYSDDGNLISKHDESAGKTSIMD